MWSSVRAICDYLAAVEKGITSDGHASAFVNGLLTGLGIGSDFDADLPAVVKRYLDLYRCP